MNRKDEDIELGSIDSENEDHDGENNSVKKLLNHNGMQQHQVEQQDAAADVSSSLHDAAETNNKKLAEYIISNTPSEDFRKLIDLPNEIGETALHRAILKISKDTFEVLLAAKEDCYGDKLYANPNLRDDWGDSPLHLFTHDDIISSDVSKKADLLEMLKLLLLYPGIDLNPINSTKKRTPLQSAVAKMKRDISTKQYLKKVCILLIQYGAAITSEASDFLDEIDVESAYKLAKGIEKIKKNPTSEVYNSIILKKITSIRNIWEADKENEYDIKEEITEIINGFIGSKRILFHFVDECDEEGVNFLLDELDADPLVKNIDGEISLYRSLARSCVPISKALLTKMKDSNDTLDLSKNSDLLIKKTLQISAHEDSKDSLSCLRLLLDPDYNIDISVNSLHFAASINNQEAMSIMIARGAYLGGHKILGDEDMGTIMKTLLSDTLNCAFDDCIQTYNKVESVNLLSPDHSLRFNYGFLLPKYTEESGAEEIQAQDEVSVVNEMSHISTIEDCLKHPLMQVYLCTKWLHVRMFYYFEIMVYSFLVFLLTAFVFIPKKVKSEPNMSSDVNLSNTTMDKVWDKSEVYSGLRLAAIAIALLVLICIAIKEVFQIKAYGLKKYLSHLDNILDCVLLFFSLLLFVDCIVTLPQRLGNCAAAVTILAIWFKFMFTIGRLPSLTVPITYLKKVACKFISVFFPFSCMFIAFSFSFSILHQNSDSGKEDEEGDFRDFESFWRAIPLTVVMSTGEFDYKSYADEHQEYLIFSVVIFLFFLFLVFLVLMNVLTGLAVCDVKDIMDDIKLHELKSRLHVIYMVENFFLSMYKSTGKQWFKNRLEKLQILFKKNPTLIVRINEKKERVISYDILNEHGLEETVTFPLESQIVRTVREYCLNKSQAKSDSAGDWRSKEMFRMLQNIEKMMTKAQKEGK